MNSFTKPTLREILQSLLSFRMTASPLLSPPAYRQAGIGERGSRRRAIAALATARVRGNFKYLSSGSKNV